MVTVGETREYLKERDMLSMLSLFHDHKAPTIVTHAEAAAVAHAAKQEESLDIRTSYLQRHELDAAHLQPLFALRMESRSCSALSHRIFPSTT